MTLLAKNMKAFTAFRAEESMFKEVGAFRHLWDKQTSDVVRLANDTIKKVQGYARDPFAAEWAKWGFAPMAEAMPFFSNVLEDEFAEDESLAEQYDSFYEYARQQVFIRLQDDQIFFVIEKRERVLPGDTLRAEIDKECLALERRQGNPVDRKQRMEIKDVVVARELATAKIRTRKIPVLIQPSTFSDDLFDIFIFTGSRKMAEDAGHLMRAAFGSWPMYPMENDLTLPLTDLMTRLLTRPKDHPFAWDVLQHSEAAKLVNIVSNGGEVTLKDETLVEADEPAERIADLLNNSYRVVRMRYFFHKESPVLERGYLAFQLTSKGAFSGLKASESLVEETEEDNAWYDFNAFIYILSDYLGGLMESFHSLSVYYEPDEEIVLSRREMAAAEDSAKAARDLIKEADADTTDPLLDEAAAFVRESNKPAISSIQRNFRIGYNRAARILEQLEEMNVVTGPGVTGTRTVVGADDINEDDLL